MYLLCVYMHCYNQTPPTHLYVSLPIQILDPFTYLFKEDLLPTVCQGDIVVSKILWSLTSWSLKSSRRDHILINQIISNANV